MIYLYNFLIYKMKQCFNKSYHNKFIKYFWIKKEDSKIELDFYKKTEKYLKFIKWIPWLKMVWIWNSISMNCSTKDSDIDLLIVSSPNSMWLNRILITFIFQILGVRKNQRNHAWRFCLSFFTTTNWLDFSSWKIENDIYLYFWIIYFKPILSFNNTYELFIKKNNNWADFKEYWNILKNNKKYIKYSWKNNYECKIINNLLKKIFLQKTLKHYNALWKPYWVIINDDLLKFHNWDIRQKIKKELVD